MRNKLKMPGGLTDDQFYNNPRQSTRSRNWLESPWNVVTAFLNYNPSEKSTLSVKTSYLFSKRALVWRNEDGGPEADDVIDPATNQFVPREVGKEAMNNFTTEIRFSQKYNLFNNESTLAAGLRHSSAWFKRQGGGEGTTGSDFNLNITGDWGYDLNFTTTNFAPFVENIFKISERFSVTPGFRLEYLKSNIKGKKDADGEIQNVDESKTRTFALFGIGTEYKTSKNTNVYANISQAYRPVDYSQLEPFGVTSKIDPNMKDSSGFNSDLGFRGTVGNYLNFDFGIFYMAYNNRIGVLVGEYPITGYSYSIRKNIANSVHKGIESYIEFNILKFLDNKSIYGLSIFNSFGFTDAQYTTGEFKGKRVEAATKAINRIGLIFGTSHFSTTFQTNYTGDSFGDASNVIKSTDPLAGYIPSYTVLDLSSQYRFEHVSLKFGINNIADKQYFTRRTDEYPGPGIIPAVGRSFYAGITAKF